MLRSSVTVSQPRSSRTFTVPLRRVSSVADGRSTGPSQTTSRLTSGSLANRLWLGVGSPTSTRYENVSVANPSISDTGRLREPVPCTGTSPFRIAREIVSGPAHRTDDSPPACASADTKPFPEVSESSRNAW